MSKIIENPEYRDAPYALSYFPPVPGLPEKRFKYPPPSDLKQEDFFQWLIENEVPQFIEVKTAT